jgi:predicted metal-dependent hydrolase
VGPSLAARERAEVNVEQPFRRPEGLKVTYRRMQFPFEQQGFARYWHGGSAFRSLFWTQLSTAFDPGEKFFIDSARALRGVVRDEALLEELTEFCKQEGHHTAQHLKFDRLNAAHGIDVATCSARYTRALDRTRAKLDPLGMLAVTVALEHFTAGFAELYFARPEMGDGADPNVQALWAWHAAEELEHKATCYDVYRAAGGGYLRRAVTMPGAWLMILMISIWNTLWLLKRDGRLELREVWSGARYLFGRRGVVTGLLPAFFEFLSPSFHPWKRDDSAEIARWQQHNHAYIQPDKGGGSSVAPQPA